MQRRVRDLEQCVATELAERAQIRRCVHPELLEHHAERHGAKSKAPRLVGDDERRDERDERGRDGRGDDPAECGARREL
jgi:hypothetical protein